MRIQRPGTGQLLQVDLGQLEQFLEFYGKPAEAPPLKTEKVNKIIDNLINGHTVCHIRQLFYCNFMLIFIQVETVTEEEVALLVQSIDRIETVPKRGKGNGRFRCKICPHLFPESNVHGLR